MTQNNSVRREWNIFAADAGECGLLSEQLGVSMPTAALLCRRGCHTPGEARAFLAKEACYFHNPFLLPDMGAACDRLQRAIEDRERVTIYGDYDVDGITSVSILYLYLRSRRVDAHYYIPSRINEGYGLNKTAIEKIKADGTALLITVDCGITAVAEARYARELGLDLIITDHHQTARVQTEDGAEARECLPDALAVVNPKRDGCEYPYKELAGVGVVFKLLCALDAYKRDGQADLERMDRLCRAYLEPVAIGTIADVMPLVDENRLIAGLGLDMMPRTHYIGLEALFEKAGIWENGGYKQPPADRKITSSQISYAIAPRINSVGRIGDTSVAVELFLADDPRRADILAEQLCQTNRQRQFEENKIADEAVLRIESGMAGARGDSAIVLFDDEWHQGLIGIVASKLSERYSKPAALISFDGDMGKGSIRSVRGLNIIDVLQHASHLLIKYGGHEMAAGITIRRENLNDFIKLFNEYTAIYLNNNHVCSVFDMDCVVRPEEVTTSLIEEFYRLEPFGLGNPEPLVCAGGMKIRSIQAIGQNKHTKFYFERGGAPLQGLWFGVPPDSLPLCGGDVVDAACNLSVNSFRGSREAQLVIRDIRLSRDYAAPMYEQLARLGSVARGAETVLGGQCPSKETLKNVYLATKLIARRDGGTITVDVAQLCRNAQLGGLFDVGAALYVFDEMGLITISNKPRLREQLETLADPAEYERRLTSAQYSLGVEPLCFAIVFNFGAEKVDLEDSKILRGLRGE